MKELVEKLKITKEVITIIVGFVGIIITGYTFFISINSRLKDIEKITLRSMIWSEGIPLNDKLEACDTYINHGFNSETKMYCEKLLEKEFN